MSEEIGRTIAKLRQERGLSQRDLAHRLGVSGAAVAQWETGGGPKRDRLAAIAGALGVTVEALVTGSAAMGAAEQAEMARIMAGLTAEDRQKLLDLARRLLR